MTPVGLTGYLVLAGMTASKTAAIWVGGVVCAVGAGALLLRWKLKRMYKPLVSLVPSRVRLRAAEWVGHAGGAMRLRLARDFCVAGGEGAAPSEGGGLVTCSTRR